MTKQPCLGQSDFLSELGLQLDKFETRVRKHVETRSLWVWIEMLRDVVKDCFAERAEQFRRNRKAYEQLMLVELELQNFLPQEESDGKRLEGILVRVGKAKALLALTFLLLGTYSAFNDEMDYRRSRKGARIIARREMLAA